MGLSFVRVILSFLGERGRCLSVKNMSFVLVSMTTPTLDRKSIPNMHGTWSWSINMQL